MGPLLLIALKMELVLDEGRDNFVYDDATGKLIGAGATLKGNPTIAIGRNLTGRGLSDDEIDYLFANDAKDMEADLAIEIPWISSLTIARQVAMYSLYFNVDLGNPKRFVAAWPNFISQMQAADYDGAADNLETSQPWASEVGERATRLAGLIRKG